MPGFGSFWLSDMPDSSVVNGDIEEYAALL